MNNEEYTLKLSFDKKRAYNKVELDKVSVLLALIFDKPARANLLFI